MNLRKTLISMLELLFDHMPDSEERERFKKITLEIEEILNDSNPETIGAEFFKVYPVDEMRYGTDPLYAACTRSLQNVFSMGWQSREIGAENLKSQQEQAALDMQVGLNALKKQIDERKE